MVAAASGVPVAFAPAKIIIENVSAPSGAAIDIVQVSSPLTGGHVVALIFEISVSGGAVALVTLIETDAAEAGINFGERVVADGATAGIENVRETFCALVPSVAPVAGNVCGMELFPPPPPQAARKSVHSSTGQIRYQRSPPM